MGKNKGFTLAELLVVISIIGLFSVMAFGFLTSAQTKAKVAGATSSLSSLVRAVALCCLSSSNTLQAVAGSDICNPAAGGILPTAAQLKVTNVSYSVVNQCTSDNPSLNIVLTGHARTACNTTAWVLSGTKLTLPNGCSN